MVDAGLGVSISAWSGSDSTCGFLQLLSLQTPRLPLFVRKAAPWRYSGSDIGRGWDEARKGTYRPRHAAGQPLEQDHTERTHDCWENVSNLNAAEEAIRERQLAGLNAPGVPICPDRINSGDSDFFAWAENTANLYGSPRRPKTRRGA